jgi:heme O synthase-like polyprenyltransferase
MQNEKFNKQPKLLGVHFKKIGIVVMVLSMVPGLIFKMMHIALMESQKDLFKSFSYSGFLLGLLLIAFSRDKVEDKRNLPTISLWYRFT